MENKVSKTDVLSPTYNLLYEYEIKSLKVMHYDLFRLKKNKEIEHWLNGEKIVEYKVGSENIQNLISKSKFNSMPLFFKSSSGHIGLQGDHGEVWYRNIRIRKL